MGRKKKRPNNYVQMMKRIISWLYANDKVNSLVIRKDLIRSICQPVVSGRGMDDTIKKFYYALEDGLIEIHHGSKIVLTGEIIVREKGDCKTSKYNSRKVKSKIDKRKGKSGVNFYSSKEWRELRVKALVKYGRKCCLCGRGVEDGIILHVDHIKPRSKRPDLELDISNLQILCEDCNLGKSNRYSEDWRIKPQSRVADLYKD